MCSSMGGGTGMCESGSERPRARRTLSNRILSEVRCMSRLWLEFEDSKRKIPDNISPFVGPAAFDDQRDVFNNRRDWRVFVKCSRPDEWRDIVWYLPF